MPAVPIGHVRRCSGHDNSSLLRYGYTTMTVPCAPHARQLAPMLRVCQCAPLLCALTFALRYNCRALCCKRDVHGGRRSVLRRRHGVANR